MQPLTQLAHLSVLEDGLHLNPLGYDQLALLIYKRMEAAGLGSAAWPPAKSSDRLKGAGWTGYRPYKPPRPWQPLGLWGWAWRLLLAAACCLALRSALTAPRLEAALRVLGLVAGWIGRAAGGGSRAMLEMAPPGKRKASLKAIHTVVAVADRE